MFFTNRNLKSEPFLCIQWMIEGHKKNLEGHKENLGGALPALRPGPGPTRLFLSPKENMSYEHEWSVKSSLT